MLVPIGHIAKSGWLSNLGISYLARFRLQEELADIERAIKCFSEAISIGSGGQEDRLGWLDNLGTPYGIRFSRLGELVDLNKAIDCQTEGMHLPTTSTPTRQYF
jgi:hypothetical protein